MLDGKDVDGHPSTRGKGVNFPLLTLERDTRCGLDKVPVALLTNAF